MEGKTGPKVEYEIYYPFDGINLHLLDISICEGQEIFIKYPLDISKEELDLYNRNSKYYNDICYTYTNSKGTDITLNEYKEENKRLLCSCEAKSTISMISQIKVDKNKLYKFIDLRQIINFRVMKCIKLLFSIKGIQSNIGFYSFFPTIIAYIVALFVFYLKEFKKII